MPRIWNLHDTVDLSEADLGLAVDGHIAQNDTFDKVYFYTILGDVYEYDGLSATQISGTTFQDTGLIMDIIWFNGELYVLYGYSVDSGSAYNCRLYKWAGTGQTWNAGYRPDSGHAEWTKRYGRIFVTGYGDRADFLEFDDNYMYIKASCNPGAGNINCLWAGDGSTFSFCTQLSTNGNAGNRMFGSKKGSSYQRVLVSYYSGGDDPLLELASGTDFTQKTSENYQENNAPVGIALDYGFWWDFFGGTDALYLVKSDDWLTTVPTRASAMTFASSTDALKITKLGLDTVMMSNGSSNQAYTYNPNTGQFETDGTMADADHYVVNYFRLGSILYALCNDAGDGTKAHIYGGGTILLDQEEPEEPTIQDLVAKLYFGLGTSNDYEPIYITVEE